MNAMVTEGQVNGVGDGMDDMIPATLEGEQDNGAIRWRVYCTCGCG